MNEQVTQANAKVHLEKILSIMELEATVVEQNIDESTVCYRIECNDNDARFLIGRKGQTLESLQFLLRQMVKGGEPGEQEHFILDVRDYRSRRESALLDRTKRAAVGVLNGEYEQYDLPPMSAFERRIVHNYLQEHFPDLSSESHGLGISRHIVISYKGLPTEGEAHEQEKVEAGIESGETHE